MLKTNAQNAHTFWNPLLLKKGEITGIEQITTLKSTTAETV